MDNTKYIALSRQIALWNRMDIISNNMANMNTSGFKAEDTLFSSYLVNTVTAENKEKQPLYFTNDFGSYTDLTQGAFETTGNPLDIAISGEGFFTIKTDEGLRYTKKGQFALNADGAIVTSEGNLVLSEANEPIFIAPNEEMISVSATGEVSTENGVVAKLKIAEFENQQKLVKTAGVMFENTEPANLKNVSASTVVQGALEQSNVNGITELTKLINVQRSYEYVQQMIDAEHTRLSNTISAFNQMG